MKEWISSIRKIGRRGFNFIKNSAKKVWNYVKENIINIAKTVKNIIVEEIKETVVNKITDEKKNIHGSTDSNQNLTEIIIKKIIEGIFNFVLKILSTAVEFFNSEENQDRVIGSILGSIINK